MNMKEFVKWVLAVLCGLLIWGIVKTVMFFMMLGSLAASAATIGTKAPVALPKEGVLLMDMSRMALTEQTLENSPFAVFQNNVMAQVGIWDAVKAVRKAAEDPGVKFILLRTDNGVSGISPVLELREALTEFRKSGKAIVAYGESFTSGSYFLASVADKIYSTRFPGGANFMVGVSSRMLFLKDLLDKLGVNVQLIRHGKYKSAGEMYVRSGPSPENLEQYQELVNSLWKTISEETAEGRGVALDSLNHFVDNLTLNLPEDMLRHGLVDELFSTEEFKEKMAALAGKEDPKDVKYISFPDYVAAKADPASSAKKKIAIIYAKGDIIEQDDPGNISGDRFSRIIAKVRADSTVKAVVLRVNSPGGTVLAASKIKDEIDLTRAVKPVIASYGSYAASGGYWISNSCDRIFTGPMTLTGSIGVFGMVPDFSRTLKNVIHVNSVSVNSGKHSDMLSLTRPFDAEETAWMQRSIEDIYTKFLANVAEGRDMTPEAVDSIAQGRVWTGADALGIGLVDELGGIADAIEYAAGLAGDSDLASWNIVSYPKPLSPFEQILRQLQGSGKEDATAKVLEGTPFEDAAKAVIGWKNSWIHARDGQNLVFARLPYEIEIR